ncbi:hypothetical protein FQK07_12115 [Synechococcus sp. BSF8S]|uniref:hypothetical protein n=1 Tax=Synechococcales TaxID=1890424 RepID=UPI0016238339|nr:MULTISPECIES: hypothetical protein [unclassified Synechococcus]MBC1261995.1 hypothetical protein [Synechococcus sp. BSF8S]MBC1264922.1 hypothetical protein [Synechococcus sp. BSA11S]
MSQRTFQFRLRSSHSGPTRATQSLEVEFLAESGEWEPQHPSLTTPGFRLYLLSLLLCQHFYLVANAQERAIPLQRVEGSFTVLTSADWILEQLNGDFRLRLDPAVSADERSRADDEAIAFIGERMKLCPVSRNLPATAEKAIGLRLEA